MGAWGPKLYQDDLAEEVRTYYKDQLRRGKKGTDITQELILKNSDVLSDEDEASVFWFALADTQWSLGRLENSVKMNALKCIQEGSNLRRWLVEDSKNAKKREQVLEDLREKLLSPQPAEKKISQYKLYRCDWKIGDIYAYRLSSDYAKVSGAYGKHLFFVKVAEQDWYPGHIIPVIYVYRAISDGILSIPELQTKDYIPQFYTPEFYKKNPSMPPLYLLALLSLSARVIPNSQLTFIGNVKMTKRIEGENQNPYHVSWKDFEKYMIDNFKTWNDFHITFDQVVKKME